MFGKKINYMLFLRLFKESFLFALHALRSNVLRTLLSLLGITIGIFAIISVFTVVDALEDNVRTSVASLGNNVIYVQKWPWSFDSEYPWWKYINRPVPSLEELPVIDKRAELAEASAYLVSLRGKTVKYRNNDVENAQVIAVSQNYDRIKSFEIESGRYFTPSESDHGVPSALIGSNIATSLFASSDPVDNFIKVMGRKVRIIGVIKKEGESLIGNSLDNVVILPAKFARSLISFKSLNLNSSIMVKGKPGIKNQDLIEELRGIMRSARKLQPREEDNFALNQASLVSAGLDSLFKVLDMAGAIIGGFSILVGGFGIANIMFVSVRERTSQIGIQKSLGAKNYFILLQFLMEAVVLCLLGGAIGLILVFLMTLGANAVFDSSVSLTSYNIFLGLLVSAVIGVVSGFTPAYTAAGMDPVEAIRSN